MSADENTHQGFEDGDEPLAPEEYWKRDEQELDWEADYVDPHDFTLDDV